MIPAWQASLRSGRKRIAVIPLLTVIGLAALLAWQLDGRAASPPVCENGVVVVEPDEHPELVADCEALLAAKDQLRGAAALNWSADLALASWTGVTVDGSPRRVTSLRLANQQLGGTIPPELGDLSQLQLLDLGRNRLSGSIPPELGDLAELTFLLLESNRLSGSLPSALGDLWKLEVLYLDDNRLSGAIPHWLDDLPLTALTLSGNSGWSGCLPAELTGFDDDDLGDLSLSRCAALPRRALTVRLDSPARGGEISPRVGIHRYRHGARVLLRASPSFDREVAAWSGACSGDAVTCVVTMGADKTVGVSFQEIVHQLTVEPAEGGAITPDGVTTRSDGESVSLSVSWNDATHTFAGWTCACADAGTATTCTLEMTEDLTVGAEFSPLPADRCSTPTASDCIRAVFRGAPDAYAQVQEIPADKLLAPDPDGRYQVERGQQYTVVTAAPLPSGWTRFYLERTPYQVAVSPTSMMRLIPPVGTTFTFTVNTDPAGAERMTFHLNAARPLPVQRPGIKPELGQVVVTTVFDVPDCSSGLAVATPADNAALVGECQTLLQLRDTLAGTGSLNWSAATTMASWDGLTLGGTPQQVTQLSLADSGLGGELSGLLGELSALTQLRLNDNTLSGLIPSKLTQLSNLTHLYLADNSLDGCIPAALKTIANNDLASLSLSDCGAASDISYGEHTLTTGTYEYALVDDGPAVMFDVPDGLSLEIVGIVYTDSDDGGSTIGLILRDTTDQSWICVDLEEADECYRKIVSTSTDPDGIAALLDRLAESIWMDDGS